MKYRKLRIAWSVTWGVVVVLLCVLWGRSYWWLDSVSCYDSSNILVYGVNSCSGTVGVLAKSDSTSVLPITSWRAESEIIDWNDPSGGFTFRRTKSYLVIALPVWLPTLLFSVIAAIPWIRWSKRFSLRTLLIATTVIAMLLGTIVWLSK